MKTRIIISLFALAMLAISGCGPAGAIADAPPNYQGDDAAALAADAAEGIMPEMPVVWAIPQPAPAQQPRGITTWWKQIWAKIKAAINGDDDPVTPPPTPQPDPPPPTPPAEAPSNSFLWKPVSEAYSGRAVFLTPANIDVASATCNGEQAAKHPRANGNRQHFRLSKTGSAYGANVKVVATLTAGGTKTWTVPDGAARWTSR